MTTSAGAGAQLPPFAAWRHREGEPFAVRYAIELDRRWHTRSAHVTGQSLSTARTVRIAFDFRCELAYDAALLVLEYPGIASRAGCIRST